MSASAVVGSSLLGGEIVQEEQRLGAMNQQIVDAHRDQIDAGDLVPAAPGGELHLAADAIRRRHEQRIFEAGRCQVEKSREPAELGGGAGARGRTHQRLDGANEGMAGFDVDSCVPIPAGVERFSRVLCHDAWRG